MIQAIREWGGQPVARALLLSMALHVALIMLVQPRFGSQDKFVVLHARLAPQEQEAQTEAIAEEPVPQDATASEPASADADSPPPLQTEKPAPIRVAAQTPEPSAKLDALSDGSPLPATSPSADAGNAPVAPTMPAPVTLKPAADLPSVPVMQDPNWYWARQVDRRPLPLHDITPVYPEEARRSGLQGSVVVEVRIDEFGKVHEVAIIEADPPGAFEAAVLKAYGDTIFTPAMREGRPVRYLGRYRVRFDLE